MKKRDTHFLKETLKHWRYLLVTGSGDKYSYFSEHPDLVIPESGCYLCEEAERNNLLCIDCQLTGIAWGMGFCLMDRDSFYRKWRQSGMDKRRKYARLMVNAVVKALVLCRTSTKQL